MENLTLVWRFLVNHPQTGYLFPISWHLMVVLAVLGLLAAAGLHHVIGYTYGFYRLGERFAAWLALPSLVVLTVTVAVLLGAYLAAANAQELVRQAVASRAGTLAAEKIGFALINPAFTQTELDAGSEGGITRGALSQALVSMPVETLLEQVAHELSLLGRGATLVSEARPADEGEPTVEFPVEEPPRPALELVRLAQTWAGDPAQGGGADGHPGTVEEGSLSRLLLELISEISVGTPLTAEEWASVAGHRFVGQVLVPEMLWQVRNLAVLGIILVFAGNLLYFYLLNLAKQWARNRLNAKRRAPPKTPLPALPLLD